MQYYLFINVGIIIKFIFTIKDTKVSKMILMEISGEKKGDVL